MTDHNVVFTPAEYMESFDAACPQQAYHDLALASPFTAPDGMPHITRIAELIALNRHPAVHATDGVHFNLGGKRPYTGERAGTVLRAGRDSATPTLEL
jgi:hypothetical protein